MRKVLVLTILLLIPLGFLKADKKTYADEICEVVRSRPSVAITSKDLAYKLMNARSFVNSSVDHDFALSPSILKAICGNDPIILLRELSKKPEVLNKEIYLIIYPAGDGAEIFGLEGLKPFYLEDILADRYKYANIEMVFTSTLIRKAFGLPLKEGMSKIYKFNYRFWLASFNLEFSKIKNPDQAMELARAIMEGDEKTVEEKISLFSAEELADQIPLTPFSLLDLVTIVGTKEIIYTVYKKIPSIITKSITKKKWEDGRTLLHFAAEKGDAKFAKLLIRKGADVNARDKDGETPLHRAAYKGHTEIAKFLIEHGADVNAKNKWGWPPLFCAANKGIIDLLLSHGATFKGFDVNAKDKWEGETPLHKATKRGHTEVVKLFLSHGADVNAKDFLGDFPLHEAAEKGHTEIAKLLIAHGADVNAKGHYDMIPLHYAACEGHTEIAKFLIAHGADVNARDKDGETPLHKAAYKGHTEIAKLLIEHGADVNARDFLGDFPLHETAYLGHTEIAELLIAHGADVNAKGCCGWTPLHRAAEEGRTEVAKLLIEHGANINAKNENGETPCDIAREKGHKELVELLCKK